MRITGIHTGEIQIPLARPFKTALRTVERVEDIVVRITAENGMVGYGEAPPTAVIRSEERRVGKECSPKCIDRVCACE